MNNFLLHNIRTKTDNTFHSIVLFNIVVFIMFGMVGKNSKAVN